MNWGIFSVSCLFNAYIYIKYFYEIKFQYFVYIVTKLNNKADNGPQ